MWWEQLQAAGVDVVVQQKGQTAPLHAAAGHGLHELVGQLLEAGAVAVDAQDSKGRTPLHLAASEGRTGVVQ